MQRPPLLSDRLNGERVQLIPDMILGKIAAINARLSYLARDLHALKFDWKEVLALETQLESDLYALVNAQQNAETANKKKMIRDQAFDNQVKKSKVRVRIIETEQEIAIEALKDKSSPLSSPQAAALKGCIHGRSYAGEWFGSPPFYFMTFLQEYRGLVAGKSPVRPGDRIVFDHDLSPAPLRIERTVKSEWTFTVKEIPVPEGFRFNLSTLLGQSLQGDRRDRD